MWSVTGRSVRLGKPPGGGVKDPHDGPGSLVGYGPGPLVGSGVVGSCGWWPRTGPVKGILPVARQDGCLANARSCRFGWTVKKRAVFEDPLSSRMTRSVACPVLATHGNMPLLPDHASAICTYFKKSFGHKKPPFYWGFDLNQPPVSSCSRRAMARILRVFHWLGWLWTSS